jgi:hypothetical protein
MDAKIPKKTPQEVQIAMETAAAIKKKHEEEAKEEQLLRSSKNRNDSTVATESG